MPELTISELLRPVAEEHPAGADLRYSAIYEQIKEARREDDGLAQGAWQRERKLADYRTVIELTRSALSAKTKDLQLAAWLAEALVHEQGYSGLRFGLELCLGLIAQFWDGMYPPLEDGDAELRAAPLAWLASKLDIAVRKVSLVEAGHDWFAYKQSRAIGYESSAATPEQKKAREKALSEGKLSAEAFDKEFEVTPRAYYVQADNDLSNSLSIAKSLQELCTERFGDATPGFGKLQEAIAEVQHTVHALLQKKGPPPAEGTVSADAVESETSQSLALKVSSPPNGNGHMNEDSIAPAMHALRAGQYQQAMQLLSRDAASQSCGRARFLRKLELVRVCIAAGKDAIAQPILDDLASLIDAHRLDEWEEQETVAGALVTILQSSKRVQADAKEKQKFFERICRLDPSQAIGLQL